MALLPGDAIADFVDSHPDWTWTDDTIRRTYEFTDFAEAMEFVNQVAEESEAADHHPDIDIRWNEVTLVLSTHSEGGLTRADLDLAAKCDDLVAN